MLRVAKTNLNKYAKRIQKLFPQYKIAAWHICSMLEFGVEVTNKHIQVQYG